MTPDQIKTKIADSEYDFLRTNPHLGNRIIFLTLGGSHAYGTNVETSDVDIRGCALNSRTDILGLSNFEQVVNETTDTTVYGFNKLISLLLSCNPNTIEMLGCKPEHYIYMTGIGREMIANSKLFLSQRAIGSFGGYANQQLQRLKNALARDRVSQAENEEHVRNSMQRAFKNFANKYSDFDHGSVTLFTDISEREELEREVFCDISLNHFPGRDFSQMLNILSDALINYEKLNHRNRKDDAHLNKHAQHLVRLYLMCFDILEKEEIHTYRENDREFLLSIRNGAFMKDDGTYRPEFFEMIKGCEKRLDYAKRNTSLPQHPDMQRVEEFVMSVNRRSIDVS